MLFDFYPFTFSSFQCFYCLLPLLAEPKKKIIWDLSSAYFSHQCNAFRFSATAQYLWLKTSKMMPLFLYKIHNLACHHQRPVTPDFDDGFIQHCSFFHWDMLKGPLRTRSENSRDTWVGKSLFLRELLCCCIQLRRRGVFSCKSWGKESKGKSRKDGIQRIWDCQ